MGIKRIFPKIKKHIKGFFIDESGKVSRKDALGIGIAGAILSSGFNSFSAAAYHFSNPSSVHSNSGPISNHCSGSVGQISQNQPIIAHSTSTVPISQSYTNNGQNFSSDAPAVSASCNPIEGVINGYIAGHASGIINGHFSGTPISGGHANGVGFGPTRIVNADGPLSTVTHASYNVSGSGSGSGSGTGTGTGSGTGSGSGSGGGDDNTGSGY